MIDVTHEKIVNQVVRILNFLIYLRLPRKQFDQCSLLLYSQIFTINYQDCIFILRSHTFEMMICTNYHKFERQQNQMNKTFDKVIKFIIILKFIGTVHALTTIDSITPDIAQESSPQLESSIFGVRWRLGNALNLQQAYHNNEYYVLQFNSYKSLNAETYVKFKNMEFACAESSIYLQNSTMFIHTCRINEKLASPYQYQIIMKDIIFSGQENGTHISSSSKILLFEGKLRISNIGASVLVLGDILFDRNGSLLCDNSQFEKQDISIVVIGNILPQFNGSNYAQILTFLEPITSQAITIPLNQLRQGSNLYYQLCFPYSLSIIKSDYMMFSFDALNFTMFLINPEENVSNLTLTLSQDRKQQLKNELVLVVSPFQQLEDNAFLKEVSLDVHLTTQKKGQYSKKIICYDNTSTDSANTKKCPYMISEGNINMKTHNTNFGIFHIDHTNEQKTLSFNHYSQCITTDKFNFSYIHQSNEQPPPPDGATKANYIIQKIILAVQYAFIIFLIVFLIITFISLRKKQNQKKKNNQKHIQLVEQIVANSQNSRKQ